MNMMAEDHFNTILRLIQDSRLNFQLQLTPFSAVISLKKAFIKDQNGSYVLPNKSSERKCDDKDSQDVISFSKYEKLEAEYVSACKKANC